MEKQETTSNNKAHVLVFPYPSQGHINPMLQFAKRLVTKGALKITLVTTKYLNKTTHISKHEGLIGVETISDGFDEGGYAEAESAESYLSTFQLVGSQTLANLIKKLKNSPNPVTALVYDGFLPWGLDVAKTFGLTGVVFFTQLCSVNIIYYHVYNSLLKLPLSGINVSLPGLPLLDVSETPSFVGNYGSYPSFDHMVMNQFMNIDEVDWVLCNTFYELEAEVVDWMAQKWRLRTIGPTVPSMYLDKRVENDKDYGIDLFKPNTDSCMNWLQNKPISSVVYVSFGSISDLGVEQMEELARGLKESDCYVLWVVRASEEAKLPKNFIAEASKKCLVVTWCKQLEVLSHKSIGCFVTHCGFNSVLEALCLGVPLVAMPQWTDQPTNAKFVEDVWRVGVRAKADEKGIVRREEVKRCIREVMEGAKKDEIKESANKWKKLAREAIDKGGTSDRNIDEFVGFLNDVCGQS